MLDFQRIAAAITAVFLIGLACVDTKQGTAPATSQPGVDEISKKRRFEFNYSVKLKASETSSPVDVFIPMPVKDAWQRVVSEDIDASIKGTTQVESVYGNRFWHGRYDPTVGEDLNIKARYVVERMFGDASIIDKTRESPESLAPFLVGSRKVIINDPVLKPILKEIDSRYAPENSAEAGRAIFDWVVENVEYKKVGTGWGNGDTYWACSERYGNCTDFHSLFISLARTKSIPARFEMGFPVPQDKQMGAVKGYHCWLRFYLPQKGWVMVDASEAAKANSVQSDSTVRDQYFGNEHADRIHFSTGRDLRLGEHHRGAALNYFIYPYLESGGNKLKLAAHKSFSYKEIL